MAGYVLDTWILHKLGLSEVNVAIDNVSPIPSCFIWLALRLCPSAPNIMEPPLSVGNKDWKVEGQGGPQLLKVGGHTQKLGAKLVILIALPKQN